MSSREFITRRSDIEGVELVEADSGRSFSRHTHDQFGIGLIFRGAQTSASGRGQVEAGAGDIITVNPGEVHDGSPIGGEGRHWKMLYLDPALVLRVIADVKDDTCCQEFRHPVLRERAHRQAFAALFGRLSDGRAIDEIAAESLLFSLVARLLVEKQAARGSLAPIDRAREMIDGAPERAYTLDDLSRAAGIGKFELLRGFAKGTGMTPHAYLMQKRIDMARRLIRAGSSLADAALASGFSDQSHMTRIFASKYGVTPGAYAAAFA